MKDIVERLAGPFRAEPAALRVMDEAADEIERLRAWNAEIALNARYFAEALRDISDLTITSTVADIYGDTQKEWLEQFDYAQSIARAALEGK